MFPASKLVLEFCKHSPAFQFASLQQHLEYCKILKHSVKQLKVFQPLFYVPVFDFFLYWIFLQSFNFLG